MAPRSAPRHKIHAASDGEGLDSPRYRELLEVAREKNLPVILHAGCIQNRLFYKDPECGRAELFAPWFEGYPEVSFILAHMNFHEPHKAIELAELHSNVFLDNSWQPPEIIGEAVRRVGAERVLKDCFPKRLCLAEFDRSPDCGRKKLISK